MDLPKKYDLIFVGRLVENKGINLLIKAVSKLRAKNEKLKVLIVGGGPLEGELKSKIKSLKLQDTLMLYGRAKDSLEIARLLNESKILVMPSYNEGGPRVVVEAMACGVPVVSTDCPSGQYWDTATMTCKSSTTGASLFTPFLKLFGF